MIKKKTDKIDAKKLAIFLKMQVVSNEELIKAVHVPEETIRDLQAYFSSYELFKKIKTQIKNRTHALLKQNLYPTAKASVFTGYKKKEIFESSLSEGVKTHLDIFYKQVEHLEGSQKEVLEKICTVGSQYKE